MRTPRMLVVSACLAAAVSLALVGCAPASEPAADDMGAEAPAEEAAAPEATQEEMAQEEHQDAAHEGGDEHAAGPHWGYEGDVGPEYWGEMDEAFVACSAGTEQSPIDLTDATAEDVPDPVLSYSATAVDIVNNGHAVQVNYAPGSTLDLDGHVYELAQFHFHSPSEHTVDGANLAAEMHLVHKDAEGNLAVVGVLIDTGDENAAFAPVWDNLPAEAGEELTPEGVTVNVADLLPDDSSTYRYSGSLTTPPCTEGVTWLVMKTPVTLSPDQIAAFQAVMHGDNRPVQPLNERVLMVDSAD